MSNILVQNDIIREPSNILIVDSVEAEAQELKEMLDRVFSNANCLLASSLTEALECLNKETIHFIVTELNLSDSEGLVTISNLIGHAQNVPAIVYTNDEDADLALQAMKLGAQDFLIKGRGNEHTVKRVIQYSMERKNFETELYRKEQLLRTFIKHAPASVAVFDAKVRYITASERWLSDFKLQEYRIIGKSLFEIFPHAEEEWKHTHARAMKGEVVLQEKEIFHHKDGSEDYIRLEILPWYTEENEVGGVIMATELITKRIEMEIALHHAKTELEYKVFERTRELENAKLRAEAASQAKTELFTNLTHELRTPLHAITNFSKFGIKKYETAEREKLKEYFDDINTSGNRLLMLLNDILDLSKIQAMKMKLDIKSQRIEEPIKNAISELSSLVQTQKIKLAVDDEYSKTEAYFDHFRLIQVIINLISNAIKFSDKRTTVTIRIRDGLLFPEQEVSPAALLISVMDEGAGIPDDEIETIFDEFSQSQKVKSGAFSAGTGLGLAICREIVQGQGGVIWAENNPDKGASVNFTVPVNAKDVPKLQTGGTDENTHSG